jgi:hypothetical protein
MAVLDLNTGAVVWSVRMAPPGFPGNAVWGSSPAIDSKRGQLYVATGNNYDAPQETLDCIAAAGNDPEAQQACLPADNHFDSVAVGLGWVEPGFRHGTRISLTPIEGATRRLEPGGFVEYPYEAFDKLTDLQRPIRAWAEYTGNKVAWSEAKYRAHAFLTAQGPDQIAKFGDLAEADTPAPPAEPVERWWKLWAPRHMRRVTQPRS